MQDRDDALRPSVEIGAGVDPSRIANSAAIRLRL